MKKEHIFQSTEQALEFLEKELKKAESSSSLKAGQVPVV